MFTANYKGVGRRSRTLIEGEREGGGGGQGEESQAKLPRKYRMPFKVWLGSVFWEVVEMARQVKDAGIGERECVCVCVCV